MANINGTNKADYLLGTSGNDTITGHRGADWLEGAHGDDFIDVTDGNDTARDTVAFRTGDGHDQVAGFTPGEDKIMIDTGSHTYSDVFDFGAGNGTLYDGEVLTNWTGTAHLFVSAVDPNNDGITDTRLTLDSGDYIDILGVAPDQIFNADIMGG
jgi:Hemolysin-type calcium-binding repeat (2 copies).